MKDCTKTIVSVLIACLVFAIMAGQPAFADISLSRPIEGDRPTQVRVRIFVLDLDEINTADQSFVANVYLEARWHDQRLAHEGSDKVSRSLNKVWNPRIQIINQQKVWPTFPEIVEISPTGEVVYRQRVWGSFSQPLKLKNFPFDRQIFTIQLTAASYTPDEVELLPNPDSKSGVARNLSITDWDILNYKAEPVPFKICPGAPDNAGFTLSFEAKRQTGYFIVKVIIPLLLIVAMSWIVFWIDPKESGTQISVAITTMLTLIAYRFAVGTSLPKVSYLTRLDYLILGSTFLVFSSLIEVIITSTYSKSGHHKRAQSIDRVARWMFPSMFALLALQSLVL